MSDALYSEQIEIDHGRRLALYRLSRGSRPVVLCHAAPGSGYFDPDPHETRAYDTALLSLDRAGYGDSDPPWSDEWATPARAAEDIASVLDRLRLGPVGVAGWSAGGRVALALAARRPDLVTRLAVLATPAPDEYVPWIPPEQKNMVMALDGRPPAEVHAQLGDVLRAIQPGDAHGPEALAGAGASPADGAILKQEDATERLGMMMEQAWKQGPAGIAADIAGYVLRPWGFEAGEVGKETLLLYAQGDPLAGPAHGEWWSQNLPNARLELIPSAGHLLVIPQWGKVLGFLAAAA